MECHGTGTKLGDPIEVQAAAAVYGEGRDPQAPLLLGAVKTNLGHLEACAGLAGVTKVLTSLEHQGIPKNLHHQTPNPHIPWDRLPVQPINQFTPWPRGATPRRAGVSSFGFAGTNAHAVLEEAPLVPVETLAVDRPQHLLPLSAKSEAALLSLIGRYEKYIATSSEVPLADIAATASLGRAHFQHRAFVVGKDHEAVRFELQALLSGQTPLIPPGASKVVFLFTGGMSQYPGMGRLLFETSPRFRRTMERCAEILAPRLEQPLLKAIYPEPGQDTLLGRVDHMLPAIFAIEYALADLWRSWGVVPAAVMGHSTGEVAAATFAGALSLEDGLMLIAERGRLMHKLPAGGGMGAINAPAEQVAQVIARYPDLGIGAINSPQDTVVSGGSASLDAVLAEFEKRSVKVKRLRVSLASHSPLTEPMWAAYEAAAAQVKFREPEIEMVSTITGKLESATLLGTPGYWRRTVNESVQFARGMETLGGLGATHFVEVGPNPTLLGLGSQCLKGDYQWLPSMRDEQDDWGLMLRALGTLYSAGVDIDWSGFEADYRRGRTKRVLPTYPFQRKRFWVELDEVAPTVGPQAPADHPLLGTPFVSALKQTLFEAPLNFERYPLGGDHRVMDSDLVPGLALTEVMSAAAEKSSGPVTLENVALQAQLVISESTELKLQSIVGKAGEVAVFAGDGDDWLELASARTTTRQAATGTWAQVSARLGPPADDASLVYQQLEKQGVKVVPSARRLAKVKLLDGEAVASLSAAANPFGFDHGALAAGQELFFALTGHAQALVPQKVDRATIFGGTPAWVHVALTQPTRDTADLRFYAADGGCVAEVLGVVAQVAPVETLRQKQLDDWLYQVNWKPVARGATIFADRDPRAGWLILVDGQGVGQRLAEALSARGERIFTVARSTQYTRVNQHFTVGPDAMDLVRVVGEAFLGEAPLAGVVSLWGLDHQGASDTEAAEKALLGGALQQVEALTHLGRTPPRYWVVTQGAQPVAGAPKDPLGALLWGWTRIVALEHPDLHPVTIDLDPEVNSVDELVNDLLVGDRETQIGYRSGRRYGLRIMRLKAPKQGVTPRSDRTYLITGGLGGLGFYAAQWLVEQGARSVVLMGRRAPSSEIEAKIAALSKQAQVEVMLGDVAEAADVERIVGQIRRLGPPLGGILHTAGLVDYGLLGETDLTRARAVLAPKVRGTLNLHHATKNESLDFFVFYSSFSAVLGSPGLASYAAANAFLDSFAVARQAEGRPTLSLHWGTWSEVGMGTKAGHSLESGGMYLIPPRQGMEGLARALSAGVAEAGVNPIRWREIAPVFARSPLVAELVRRPVEDTKTVAGAAPALSKATLLGAQPSERQALVEDWVAMTVARALGTRATEIDRGRPLNQMGLDSLMAVELRNKTETNLGLSLPMVAILEGPSVAQLAARLVGQLDGDDAGGRPVVEQTDREEGEL